MRTGGMGCRSHAATAVCVPGDARSMIVPRRPDRTLIDDARLVDVKYTRLGDNKHGRLAPINCRRTAVTLPMVTKKERSSSVPTKPSKPKSKPKPKPKPKISTAQTSGAIVSHGASMAATEVASSNDQVYQVVVMKVSIHCQGCAGKVRKHLSKMEGVTSFSIDLESKKVTVMGHVSPAGVLESLSKVKKAELLPALIEN
ncbi:Heavy metal-associated isoprenylated plant protein 3 [Rhynchospora pubera]|uniref:Heavy metal-associated isoprenylated plant protein 3 n=1 Tax=Rhynchospora pubera TaxID=906938 RepID=A0AAV8BPC4_9POAL|nr:Heavy metal-associated isoprenylated plant protein 3 [Rhynchospora pubera]